VKHFKDGNMDIADLPCSDRPRTTTMECNEQKVDALITEDKGRQLRKIIMQLGIGHSDMQLMIKDSGILESLSSLGSLTADRQAQKGTDGRVIAVAAAVCC
jgi:hypothetical protein